jgi:hypothetical protein
MNYRKPTLKLLTAGALVLAATNDIYAQYTAPVALQPFPGFVNDYLRKKDPYNANWDISGSSRFRFEYRANGLVAPPFFDFKAGGPLTGGNPLNRNGINGEPNDNDFVAMKLLYRIGYTDEWWNFMLEGRTSSVSGDTRGAAPNINNGASPDSDGPADLHQGYVTIGNHKEFPVSLKLGRQELAFGDERIIGAFAWNNIGRVFDAAKVRWQNSWFSADFFGGAIVIPEDNEFNKASDYEHLFGMYATTRKVPKHSLDFYTLYRHIGRDNPNQFGGAQLPGGTANSPAPFNFSGRDVISIGTRLKSNPGDFGNWDYTVELIGQFGSYINDRPDAGAPLTPGTTVVPGRPANGNPNAPRLNHVAFAGSGVLGYTFAETAMTPRVALEYNYASGDSDPTDGDHGTFDNFYPTNHKFYGYADYASLQNLHNVRLSCTIKPTPTTTLALEAQFMWLADTSDVFYNAGSIPRAGSPGTLAVPMVGAGYRGVDFFHPYLGSEIDLVGGIALNKFANLEAGLAYFFHGPYQQQTFQNVGGAANSLWTYVQLQAKF